MLSSYVNVYEAIEHLAFPTLWLAAKLKTIKLHLLISRLGEHSTHVGKKTAIVKFEASLLSSEVCSIFFHKQKSAIFKMFIH